MDKLKAPALTSLLLLALASPGTVRADVCGESAEGVSKGGIKQRDEYCEAAKAADKAAKAQEAASAVQAAVGVVCTAACASSFASVAMGGGIGEGYCQASSIGATLYTMAKAKEVNDKMQAMMGLLGPGMAAMQNGIEKTFDFGLQLGGKTQVAGGAMAAAADAQSSVDAAQAGLDQATREARAALTPSNVGFDKSRDAFNKVDLSADPNVAEAQTKLDEAQKAKDAADKERSHASCMTAAFAAVQSFTSASGASNSKESAQKNRESAASVMSNERKALSGGGGGIQAGAATGQGGGATVRLASRSASAEETSDSSTDGSCAGTSFGATLSCAMSQPNSNIPAFVASPGFKEALEKISGLPADQLVGLRNPQAILQAGTARTLPGEAQSKFGQILAAARASVGDQMPSSVYASAGGRSGSGDSMPDFGSLLDKLMPKDAAGTPAAQRSKAIELGNRSLASAPGDEENRALSLFVRVSNRYHVSSRRVSGLEYQLRQNRD